MNRIKRISALLLAALMAISLVPASAFARAEAPMRDAETIVGWNFDVDAVATTANANNAGAAVSRDNGVACNFTSNGVTGKSISSNAWNGASAEAPKYYTATVNAAGYEGIAVSVSVRASNTGPKNVLMYYSINGTDFIAVDGASVSLASGSVWGTVAGTLPAECDGAESIELRIAVIDTVSANNGTVGSTGTLRMDDLTVTGTLSGETPDPTDEPDPTAEPDPTDEPDPTAEPDPTEAPVVSTIAEALAAEVNKEGITVEGIVTLLDGRNVYVEDATAGIDLYLNSNTVPSGLALGDLVRATGKRADYNGLPELTSINGADAAAFSIVSTGNTLPLQEVTVAQLLADPNAYICERVHVTEAVMGTVNTSGSTPITQDGSSIYIYKMPANSAVEGDTVNVTAVVGMHTSGVQLRVALAQDVVVVSSVDPTAEPDPTDVPDPTAVPDPTEVPEPADDPIDPALYPDYTTIASVLAMSTASGTATVVGQVTMKFGNFGDLNSVLLGDVEDGQIIGLQVYDYTNINSYNVGDIVAVTGTVGEYGGVRQLSSVTAVTVLNTETAPMPAQEVTIAELKANIANYLSEYVVIKDAVLGAYSSSASTTITDAAGETIPIYRAAVYPDGVVEGDTVDVYAAASKYNTTVQLRNGAPTDYVASAPAYITIAEALALEANAQATVRGVVTFIDGRNVYVQDATAGIDVYLNANASGISIGDMVQATGTRATFRGLPELSGVDGTDETAFKVLSSGNALPLETVTLEALLADTAAYMCERIKVEAATLGAVNTSGNTPITQDESTVNIYKIPEIEYVEGDVVDVIAIVSCYNSVQLRVVDASCINEAVIFVDPITDDMFEEGDMTIPQVIAADDSTSVTVVAQLVYRFGNYDSVNSAILEDIIDGEIYGLQVYNSLDDYQIGDVLRLKATKTTYGGVPQIQSVESAVKLTSADRIPAQPFDTFSDMLANKENLLSEYVMVRNVTLGAYNDNGSTTMTDASGVTMPVYRAASYTSFLVEAGEVVDLCAALSKYTSNWQFRGGEYFGQNKAPIITLGTFLDAEVGVDYDAAAAVVDDYGIASVTLTYTVGEVTGTVDMEYSQTNSKYRAVVPGSAIVAGVGTMTLTFTATDTSGLVSEATVTVNIVDEPQIVAVSPLANSATHDEKHPVISAEFANAGENPTAVIAVSGVDGETVVSGNTATLNYTGDLEDGKYTATVTVTRADGASVTYSWSFTVGEPRYGYYYGQLHAHTAEYSDGAGTLEDVYSYVTGLPESENVDFLAVTDHSNYFDTKDNVGDFLNVESGTIAANGHSKWYNYTTLIDEFNTRQNNVIFIGGYEMTWSGQYGHMNTYNSTGIVSRQNSIYTVQGGAGLVAYYDLIKQHTETIHAFNHPGTTFGNFDNFGYYDVAADRVITMVEVGNGEGAIGGSAYWPSYEQYTLALDMGWHVAPTNNQDNHKGRWGNANTARDVIITDNFTEEGIYEAMRSMTMYATEDKNLEIYYTLNDQIMGTVIPENEDEPITAVNIYASVSDPDGEGVGTIEVVVNGGLTAYSENCSDSSAVVEATIPNDYSYYFIRVTQQDGDIAVTAPVWVGDVSKVGISDITTETIIPVKDEQMTFTTTLYDYEATDFVIESIMYYIQVGQNDAVLLDTIENPGTIASNSELEFNYNFTPTALGAQKFSVLVSGYLGETYMQFTHIYEMDVLDPSELLDIGIDYGHANFYVSGNYAGSDAAFIELCAQNAIRTNYVHAGELTYDNIKDYVLLVLTVPYVGWENVGEANLYTEDELSAIAQYAANGGNLIVCSKSDRGNPTNAAEQAHNITNGILEAIGTDTRIANGIVVDNVEKANEAYRIYFTSEDNYTYTVDGEPVWLLKDVLETTNNSFSGYNSAPVIAGQNAISIIKGYSTTWGANYTANFGGSSSYVPNYDTDEVVVPMGEVVEMTLEDLAGGGWLITSGVTFFSTFEVKVEIENATTQQNSNYQIVMNIINALKPEPVITPIAEVNASEPGGKYTVEGYVTSNASGYDQDTAFFDCIYIQDETAGINLFPVAGDFHIGQYVRATGVLGAYNGERELVVTKIEAVEGHDEQVIAPTELSTSEAMSPDWTGTLVQIQGTVESLGYSSDGALETIMVNDGSGSAMVFIDGYIMSDYIIDVNVGDTVSAIGLASITVDTSTVDGGYVARLRVRNRAEIVVTHASVSDLIGDVNCDGVVTASDISALFAYVMNAGSLSGQALINADVNGDGSVDATDASLIAQMVFGN